MKSLSWSALCNSPKCRDSGAACASIPQQWLWRGECELPWLLGDKSATMQKGTAVMTFIGQTGCSEARVVGNRQSWQDSRPGQLACPCAAPSGLVHQAFK